MSVFVGNTTTDTIRFENINVGFVTDQKVGIANVNPANTLDIGSNVSVSDTAANTIAVKGNVSARNYYGDYYYGDGGFISNVQFSSGNVIQSVLFSNSTTSITTYSNVGISNLNPVHTLDIGSKVSVSLTESNVLVVRGAIKADDGYFISNLNPNAVYTGEFSNATTAFVTVSKVGIANVAPQHTLDIGSNISISDEASNAVINVLGNVVATYFYGDGRYLSNVVVFAAANIVGNVMSDTIEFRDPEVAFVTSRKVGIANLNPQNTLDVGSNLSVDDLASNVVSVKGNVVARYFTGDGRYLTNVVMTSNLASVSILGADTTATIGMYNPLSFVTGGVRAGISNQSPIHTLDVGSNLYINDTSSEVLFVNGNIVSTGNIMVTGNITATYFAGDGTLIQNVTSNTSFTTAVNRANYTSNVVQFRNPQRSFVAYGPASIANSNPNPVHTLDVGSNVYIQDDSPNVFVVRGIIVAHGFIGDGNGVSNVISATDLEVTVNAGNVTSNTVQFANATTAFVTFSNVGVANLDPQHTLDVGSNLYVQDDAGYNSIMSVTGNVSAYYFKGDGRYLSNVPTCSICSTLNYVTNIGNTTANTVRFVENTVSLITESNVGIANEFPIHTMDIGSNIYLNDSTETTIFTTGNIISNYIIADGSRLYNLSATLDTVINNGNVTSNIARFTHPTQCIVVASNIKMDGDLYITSPMDSSIRLGAIDTDGPVHSPGLSNTNRIAIGTEAGQLAQYQQAVAIGMRAGNQGQGESAVAIGIQAGESLQRRYAMAIGFGAGNDSQNAHAIAIGYRAGLSFQNVFSTAIGSNAGCLNQESNAMAIGEDAGYSNQSVRATAIGSLAGRNDQGYSATAVGYRAGDRTQGSYSLAVGNFAGSNVQAANCIALGSEAGYDNQGANAFALGVRAGYWFQGRDAIALGTYAGLSNQDLNAIAIGNRAGQYNQNVNTLAIGTQAGRTSQNVSAFAVGHYAGWNSQGINAHALGHYAGYILQGTEALAVGLNAGYSRQGAYSFAFGTEAGYDFQGANAVAIGMRAGYTSQGTASVAIAHQAGMTSQSINAIAIGIQSGMTNQGETAVAIGSQAGMTSQGANAFALGEQAGMTSQGIDAYAIGFQAGTSSQGMAAYAIGKKSGFRSQGANAIAIGFQSGMNVQSIYSIAIGSEAGSNAQGSNSICIGHQSSFETQGRYSIAIGFQSGYTKQLHQSVSIGYRAGLTSQNSNAVAIGTDAGYSLQGPFSISLGYQAGYSNQTSGIAIGREAGRLNQRSNATAIGIYAGYSEQQENAFAVGFQAGYTSQGKNAVAIGVKAGYSLQGNNAIAIGFEAGNTIQNNQSIAIGYQAGFSKQTGGIAIGTESGKLNQRSNATAIGIYAGYSEQQENAFAVGFQSGYTSQGKNAVAIGVQAGYSIQNNQSIAIGYQSGYSNQTGGIAIGTQAGRLSQRSNATAIGAYAGYSLQGNNAVAIGFEAGNTIQNNQSIAIGYQAGFSNQTGGIAIGTEAGKLNQRSNATAIGIYAGYSEQQENAFAVGFQAGYTSQGKYAVAIGVEAGYSLQGNNTVAIGFEAGYSIQNNQSIAIGYQSGYSNQTGGIAIGTEAGKLNQRSNATAIGIYAGYSEQQENAFAVGFQAGYTSQGKHAVAIGVEAGYSLQGNNTVAIGFEAGYSIQNNQSIAIGYQSGYSNQTGGIAIGTEAGKLNQRSNATAIGIYAGYSEQQENAFAVGFQAGYTSQGKHAVAIGVEAGYSLQGNNTVAIGFEAGYSIQNNQSIAIGYQSGYSNQTGGIAIGTEAGKLNQRSNATAIGIYAGYSEQQENAFAVGFQAGYTSQGKHAVAIGVEAGYSLQGNNAIAIGVEAGYSLQGNNAIAIGVEAGYSLQGNNAIAIGFEAGNTIQNNQSIAIGYQSGYSNQTGGIAIGTESGKLNQRSNAAAIGIYAGYSEQQENAFAVGFQSGYTSQGKNAVAIGVKSGYSLQGSNAVAIGVKSGYSLQGNNAVAIGFEAGNTIQNNQSIAIGYQSGFSNQTGGIAIGTEAGKFNQDSNATAIGIYAGYSLQSQNAFAVGFQAGYTSQGKNAVAIGVKAGYSKQGNNAIAIGFEAGNTIQNIQSIAIGYQAGFSLQGINAFAVGYKSGYTSQGDHTVAIGVEAGSSRQGLYSVAMGHRAGYSNQTRSGVAIGQESGYITQGGNAVAIGTYAGYSLQGSNSIAIGKSAGYLSTGVNSISIGENANAAHNYSIVLNATGNNTRSSQAGGFFVNPVTRDENQKQLSRIMSYTPNNEIITNDCITLTATGNIQISGNLLVTGDFATITSNNSIVNDSIVLFGNNNNFGTLDLGIVFYRGSQANVGIGYREDEKTFMIGHTLASPYSVDMVPDMGNNFSMNVYGSMTVTNTAWITKDEDVTSFIGRAALGYAGTTDFATFAHHDRNTSNDYAIGQNSTGGTLINARATELIDLRLGNSTKMRMHSTGNVTVGTVIAQNYNFWVAGLLGVASRMDVGMDTDAASNIGRATIGFNTADSDVATFSHFGRNTGVDYALAQTAAGETWLNSSSGQATIFRVNDVEEMRLHSNGNVGIGTTNPVHPLAVVGDIQTTTRIRAGEDTDTTSFIGRSAVGFNTVDSDVATFAHFDMNNATNYALGQTNAGETWLNSSSGQAVIFRVNDVEEMRLASNGNVGIGTTTPAHPLDVVGDIQTTTRIRAGEDTNTTSFIGRSAVGFNTVDSDVATFAHFDMNNATNYALGQTNAGETWLNSSSGQAIIFRVNDVEEMRLASNGNVGIGTTTPVHPLAVVGDIQTTTIIRAGEDTDATSFIGRSAVGFNTADGDVATFAHFDRNTGVDYALAQTAAGETWLNSSLGQATIFRVNDVEEMRLHSNGNVGIGTTNPVHPLDVVGDIRTTTAIHVGEDTDTTSFIGRSAIGFNTADSDVATFSHFGRNTGVDYALAQTAAGETWLNSSLGQATIFRVNDVEEMRLHSNGNVGIGTTNPVHPLAVVGDIQTTTRIRAGEDTDTTSFIGRSAVGFNTVDSDVATFAHFDMNNATNYALGQTNAGETWLNSSSGQAVIFRVSDVEEMRLASNGNVGIGTTDPALPLDVVGDIRSTTRIRAGQDTDTTSFIGRAAIGFTGHSDWASFGHVDRNDGVNYALIQNTNGFTLLNAAAAQGIEFRLDNAAQMKLHSTSNVTIGTDQVRNYKLHVEGNFNVQGDYYQNQTRMRLVPVGSIILWSGATNAIPGGYVLCDGGNGTPDLRDRFIVGAGGSYGVGTTGGANSVTLTDAQMPGHTHRFVATPNINGTTSTAGAHTHQYATFASENKRGPGPTSVWYQSQQVDTSSAGDHSHTFNSTATIDANTQITGGSGAHENRPPFYALCYIMAT